MTAKFIKLDSIEKLEDLWRSSHSQPALIFKHSSSCSISAGVFRMVSDLPAEIHLVVVQDHRHISNAIAAKTGLRHESPQAIVLAGGDVVHNASHYDIDVDAIAATLNVA